MTYINTIVIDKWQYHTTFRQHYSIYIVNRFDSDCSSILAINLNCVTNLNTSRTFLYRQRRRPVNMQPRLSIDRSFKKNLVFFPYCHWMMALSFFVNILSFIWWCIWSVSLNSSSSMGTWYSHGALIIVYGVVKKRRIERKGRWRTYSIDCRWVRVN